MEFSSTWHIATPAVLSETVDGEAIIVNLDSGAYYSLTGIGAEIWGLLEQGVSLGTLLSWVGEHYAGEPQQIAAGVTALIEELLAEQLVLPGDAPLAAPDSTASQSPADRHPFVAPVLEKFTDMADLLLLDPIHEVDAEGWPHPAMPDQGA